MKIQLSFLWLFYANGRSDFCTDLLSIENDIWFSFLSRSFTEDDCITEYVDFFLPHLSFFFPFFIYFFSLLSFCLLFEWGRLALDYGRRDRNKCNALR